MKQNWSHTGCNFDIKWRRNGIGIHSESVGKQSGTHVELVWNWLENLMDCLGMCVEGIGAAGGMSGECIRSH